MMEVLFREVFEGFTDPENSREELRNAILADRLYPIIRDDSGVPGRSIAWKVFLLFVQTTALVYN